MATGSWAAAPSTLITNLRSTLISGGWSVSSTTLPYTATKTYNGKSLEFTFSSWSNSYAHFTVGGQNYYIYTGATNLTSDHFMIASVSNGFVWIQIKGPNAGIAGAKDATYGSDQGFFMITEYEPYWTLDNNTANHWCVFSSHNSTTATSFAQYGRIRKGFDGADWSPVELATVRPAIIRTDSVGNLVPGIYQQNQIVHWDWILVEAGTSTPGIRGRLKDVYFAADGWIVTGDSSVPAAQRHVSYMGSDVVVGGAAHRMARAFFSPNGSVSQFCPFGVPEASFLQASSSLSSTGGPIVLVRWV